MIVEKFKFEGLGEDVDVDECDLFVKVGFLEVVSLEIKFLMVGDELFDIFERCGCYFNSILVDWFEKMNIWCSFQCIFREGVGYFLYYCYWKGKDLMFSVINVDEGSCDLLDSFFCSMGFFVVYGKKVLVINFNNDFQI